MPDREIEDMPGQFCGVAFHPPEDTLVYQPVTGAAAQGIGYALSTDPVTDEVLICITIAHPAFGAMTAMMDEAGLQRHADALAALVSGHTASADPFGTMRSGTVQ